MILSILICTIESRKEKFNLLFDRLLKQKRECIFNDDFCEILFECDNKQISVGAKRQMLINRAKGSYIVFIDDDDNISDNYISKIINEIVVNQPDSIGFKIECDIEGKKETAVVSNKYYDWCEDKDGFKYCRTPYHKSPIKRWIAKQVGYEDLRYAEDHDYSKRLKESGLIKKESFIDEVMYYYNFKYEDPKTKYGLQN